MNVTPGTELGNPASRDRRYWPGQPPAQDVGALGTSVQRRLMRRLFDAGLIRQTAADAWYHEPKVLVAVYLFFGGSDLVDDVAAVYPPQPGPDLDDDDAGRALLFCVPPVVATCMDRQTDRLEAAVDVVPAELTCGMAVETAAAQIVRLWDLTETFDGTITEAVTAWKIAYDAAVGVGVVDRLDEIVSVAATVWRDGDFAVDVDDVVAAAIALLA